MKPTRNPIAKAVTRIKPQVIQSKKREKPELSEYGDKFMREHFIETPIRTKLLGQLKDLEQYLKTTSALLWEYGEKQHAVEMQGAAEMCKDWYETIEWDAK